MVEPYYQDDLVTLYHGDCREITEWTEADVLVTDPPYGVGYETRRGEKIRNDEDFSTAVSVIGMWGARPMVLFANHASLPRTTRLVRSHLDRVRYATWHKTNVNGAAGMGNPWLADVEFAVCGVVEWPKRAASGLMQARRWTGNPAFTKNPEAYLHPTQKPVSVMEALIDAMPKGVVADPFAGSGSTLVAARNLGRRAIGVEVEEKYCEVIASRFAQGVFDFAGLMEGE